MRTAARLLWIAGLKEYLPSFTFDVLVVPEYFQERQELQTWAGPGSLASVRAVYKSLVSVPLACVQRIPQTRFLPVNYGTAGEGPLLCEIAILSGFARGHEIRIEPKYTNGSAVLQVDMSKAK